MTERGICTIFVIEILAGVQPPGDPDLVRLAGAIKIAQTLTRWGFFGAFWTLKINRFWTVEIKQFELIFITFGSRSLNHNFRPKYTN